MGWEDRMDFRIKVLQEESGEQEQAEEEEQEQEQVLVVECVGT